MRLQKSVHYLLQKRKIQSKRGSSERSLLEIGICTGLSKFQPLLFSKCQTGKERLAFSWQADYSPGNSETRSRVSSTHNNRLVVLRPLLPLFPSPLPSSSPMAAAKTTTNFSSRPETRFLIILVRKCARRSALTEHYKMMLRGAEQEKGERACQFGLEAMREGTD